MKKIAWIFCLLMFFSLNVAVYSQETEDDTTTTEETEETVQEIVITTKEQLKAAIQEIGLENALKQALAQGVLNGQDITSAALETGNNPATVISTLIVVGIPQNDVVVAANDFGVDPGVIGEGVREGVQQRQRERQAAGQGDEAEETEEEAEETAADIPEAETDDEPDEPEETGTITVDTTLIDTEDPEPEDDPPPPPPDIISGLPGGTDPAEPVSKVIP